MATRKQGRSETPAAKRLISRREVAERYSVSVRFLEELPAADLPRIQLSAKKILYDVNDVEAFFRARRVA